MWEDEAIQQIVTKLGMSHDLNSIIKLASFGVDPLTDIGLAMVETG
jgi:hypothetical protein